jgi:hypothetical protein
MREFRIHIDFGAGRQFFPQNGAQFLFDIHGLTSPYKPRSINRRVRYFFLQ